MKDLMNSAMVGEALPGGSSRKGKLPEKGNRSRRGRRFMDENCPVPLYLVNGRRYVDRADFEAWLSSRRIEPQRKQPTSLKKWLDAFAEKTFSKME